MLLQSITLLLLFATFAKVKSKEIRISKNSFENSITVLRERSEKSVTPRKLDRDDSTTHESFSNRKKIARPKRKLQDPWIVKDFDGFQNLANFYALVVRDENIPPCGMTANLSTNSRYFMCSGAILTERHAITTASCVHFAHIYEHHIDGDMAILVGATTDYNQVIKISRIEMHPYYEYDVESVNYAVHNLAILHLECPICRELASIPKLPCNPYQDLGHLCCSNGCKILTVVQSSNNRHTVRLLNTKDLPLPEHRDEEENKEEKPPFAESSQINRRRLIKSPGKLTAAPVSFAREKTKLNLTDENLENRNVERNRYAHRDVRRTGNENNPPNISNTNKKILEDFIKNFVNTMITRLEDLIRSNDSRKELPMVRAYVGTNHNENATATDIAKSLMNKLISGVLNNRSMEKDILETYVDCPPLGTPVISNDILVGMVAYTCDDVQDWVPWKYVDISKNMDWIMDRLQNGNGESTKNYAIQKRPSIPNRSFSTTCLDPVQSISNSCVTCGNGGCSDTCGG